MIDGLDRLDRDRIVVDAEHARAFARRRAQLAGELREVVGGVQAVDRRPPAVAVDQIVPVGNQVAQRAALMTERNAAVHAARALRRQLRGGVRQIHLAPVLHALGDRARGVLLPLDLDEPGRLTHGRDSRQPAQPSSRHACLPTRWPQPDPTLARPRPPDAWPARPARACTRAASPSPAAPAATPNPTAALRRRRCRSRHVPHDQRLHQIDLVGIDERLEIDHLAIAALPELAVGVEHVGHAAAHARGEVAPGRAEHDDAPAGHVLAAVVAHALDHHVGAAVAHAEALAGHAADERLAARRAVERRRCR